MVRVQYDSPKIYLIKDIKTILESHIFYPIFVTGLSGNGKTSMIHEVCAKLKRDLIRINITVETDEDDLLGGFRLKNGETVWEDGPLIVAMKTGAVANALKRSICLIRSISVRS